MRYFAELSWKGTAYNGWQRQDNAPSVQGTLQAALSALLGAETAVTGAGRTDAGVHAAYCVAHFDCVEMGDERDMACHLNAMLPRDIAVAGITQVGEDAHARFDALSREYRYFVDRHKDPFRTEVAWYSPRELDTAAMNRAAEALLGEHDFTALSKLHSNNRTDRCNVAAAEWTEARYGYEFTIRADRFLRGMVRATVGTLVDVGRGKIGADRFREILESGDRARASGLAPARGLFLTDVAYPPEVFKRSDKL